jgi:hypothetical protein
MSEYVINAKTLDELMAIMVGHSLPLGLRNPEALACAKTFADSFYAASGVSEFLITEALELFKLRLPQAAA